MQEAVLNRVYHQVVDYQDAMTEHFLYQPSLVRNTSKLLVTSGNEDDTDLEDYTGGSSGSGSSAGDETGGKEGKLPYY